MKARDDDRRIVIPNCVILYIYISRDVVIYKEAIPVRMLLQ